MIFLHKLTPLPHLKHQQISKCPACGAVWINGQHYWTGTGVKGDEKSLANLVCGLADTSKCINPSYKSGHIYGEADTWDKRRKNMYDGDKRMNGNPSDHE